MDGVHLPYQVLAQVISRCFKLTKKIENINGSHFLFIKNLKQQNFQFLHVETYLAFFTRRDKDPSHSSSEETSSEFVWLEIKITRKQKYQGKTEQVLYKIYFLLWSFTYLIYDIYDVYHLHWFKDIYREDIF